MIKASCGRDRKFLQPHGVPAHIRELTYASIGVRNGAIGKLIWRWGVRVATSDRRVGGVTALAFDPRLGLLAVTADRDWLAFDMRDDGLAGLKAVGIAPMLDAPSRPAAMADVSGRLFVDFPDARTVSRYALQACGVAARSAPYLSISGPVAPAALVASAGYLGLVGQDSVGVRDTLYLPYQPGTVSLADHAVPELAGHRLIGLSNPEPIVPEMLALWGPSSGRGPAVLQQSYVARWGDIFGPSRTRTIAELPRTPTAMASYYNRGYWRLLLTFDPGEEGAVDVYAFDFEPNAK